MSENLEYLTCPCQHCSQKIEFPAQGVGLEVECPACHLMTKLYAPQIPVRIPGSARSRAEITSDSSGFHWGPALFWASLIWVALCLFAGFLNCWETSEEKRLYEKWSDQMKLVKLEQAMVDVVIGGGFSRETVQGYTAAVRRMLEEAKELENERASLKNQRTEKAAICFFGTIYFLPSWIARKSRNIAALFLLNLLLGWTLLGWVGALIWAVYKPQRS